MAVECKVCAHPCRGEIDEALAKGSSRNQVSKDFGLSRASVARHAAKHLMGVVAQYRPIGTKEVVNAGYLLGRIRQLEKLTLWGIGQAQAQGKLNTMFRGVKQALGCLRAYADILALQDTPPSTVTIRNIADSPEWQQLEAIVLDVLDEYPDGKRALQTRLIEAARAQADDNGGT